MTTVPKSRSSSASALDKNKRQFKDTKQSLQERLHTLLTRLSDTAKLLKEWPEAKTGEDTSIHIETTTKLIASIHKIVNGIKLVEEKVDTIQDPSGEDTTLAKKLRQIAVPLDLLEMMDFAGGLNPDCFAMGLIKEALRRLANLQRRKASMALLANQIRKGIQEREEQFERLQKPSAAIESAPMTTPIIADEDNHRKNIDSASTKKRKWNNANDEARPVKK